MHHPNITSATVSQPIANPELEEQLRDAAGDGNEDDVRSLLDKGVNVNAANEVSTSARLSLASSASQLVVKGRRGAIGRDIR